MKAIQMKTGSIVILSFAMLCGVALASPRTSLAGPVLPPPVNPLPGVRPAPPIVRPRGCPDPAAQRIRFSIVHRDSPFSGSVRIEGSVQNIGRANFSSNRGQQTVLLLEEPQGDRPRVVAQQSFVALAAGASITVRYERHWDASSEFPPSYRLEVSYDPDIYNDGNSANDDCNANNNSVDRGGSDISSLFH